MVAHFIAALYHNAKRNNMPRLGEKRGIVIDSGKRYVSGRRTSFTGKRSYSRRTASSCARRSSQLPVWQSTLIVGNGCLLSTRNARLAIDTEFKNGCRSAFESYQQALRPLLSKQTQLVLADTGSAA